MNTCADDVTMKQIAFEGELLWQWEWPQGINKLKTLQAATSSAESPTI